MVNVGELDAVSDNINDVYYTLPPAIYAQHLHPDNYPRSIRNDSWCSEFSYSTTHVGTLVKEHRISFILLIVGISVALLICAVVFICALCGVFHSDFNTNDYADVKYLADAHKGEESMRNLSELDNIFSQLDMQSNKVDSCFAGTWKCVDCSGCILNHKFCDGILDCTDGSDEALCVRIISSSRVSDALPSRGREENSPFGYLHMFAHGRLHPVCRDSFGRERADTLCMQAGFSKSVYFTNVEKSDSSNAVQFLHISSVTYANYHVSNVCLRGQVFIACEEHVTKTPYICPSGDERQIHDWKDVGDCYSYIVALYYNGRLTCQALLITHRWMLAPAHCFIGKTNGTWRARLGTNGHKTSPMEQIKQVDGLVIHQKFQSKQLSVSRVIQNDIALVRLKNPVKYSPSIMPLQLPSKKYNSRHFRPGPESLCTGIVFAENGHWGVHKISREVVMDPNKCKNLREFEKEVTGRHLCVLHEGNRSYSHHCDQATMGQFMICSSMFGETHVAAISSTNPTCASPADVPELWTWIPSFTSWIRDTMKDIKSAHPQVPSDAVSLQEQPCSGFTCRLGGCIYWWLRCDGKVDCYSDNSDEEGCPMHNSMLYPLVSPNICRSGHVLCDIDYFKKRQAILCIPQSFICDLVPDCPNGEDERNCTCPTTENQCSSGLCYPLPIKSLNDFNIKELLPNC